MASEGKFVANAKVAGVVAAAQVALNAGTDAGVQVGDLVILHRTVPVIDPDTKEELGSVKFTKLKLEINLTAERYSVAVVTDKEPTSEQASFTKVRRIKRVTEDADEVTPATVLVRSGETAEIRRVEKPLDDFADIDGH